MSALLCGMTDANVDNIYNFLYFFLHFFFYFFFNTGPADPRQSQARSRAATLSPASGEGRIAHLDLGDSPTPWPVANEGMEALACCQ